MYRRLATTTSLIAVLAALSASPAAAERACGTIHGEGQTLKVSVARGHASCAEARQTLSSFFDRRWPQHGGPAMASLYWSLPKGWRCQLATGGGGGCYRGGSTYATERDLIGATP